MIADLRDGHRDTSKDDEAIIEQIKMEKSMVEQQLSKAEHQLEQLRAELMVHHNCNCTHTSVHVIGFGDQFYCSTGSCDLSVEGYGGGIK